MFRNFTIQAHGVEEALSIAQTEYDRAFYLVNLQTVILNQQLTQSQVQRVVTELNRIPKTDKLAWILVTPQSAKRILSMNDGSAPSDMLDRFLGRRSDSMPTRIEHDYGNFGGMHVQQAALHIPDSSELLTTDFNCMA